MKAACLIVLISIASCVGVSFCYPSKPLNERPTELGWDAWLLVDQSNRHGNSGLVPRRITPKSVFIAPTFSPDSLPACAEGYKSDPMGRCVKIIKLNESVHFQFLLQQLNQQFPDYEDEPDDPSTSGPLQLNIPLLDDESTTENETDVAIVVTPSHKHPHKATSVNVDMKKNGSDKFNVENVAAILGVNPLDVEMTTMAELTTTTLRGEEETTVPTTTEGGETTESMSTTTESVESTTFLEGDAIFFQLKL